jgi:hypothetical protein
MIATLSWRRTLPSSDPQVREWYSRRGAVETGFTPLHAAARHGDAKLVAVLLVAGAVKDAELDDGRTAADVTLEAGHEALAERLGGLSLGA